MTRLTYVVKKNEYSAPFINQLSQEMKYKFKKKNLLDEPTKFAPHGIENFQFSFQPSFPPTDQNALQNALGSNL